MFSVSRPVKPNHSDYRHGHRVRRRKLVDRRLQGGLLIALIALELGMLCAAMLYLYLQFSAAIEANLFTIHRSAQAPLLPAFLKEMALVVVSMGVINTLALLVANHLWVGYIRRVLAAFRTRLERVAALDLGGVPPAEEPQHEVLTLLERWRRREVGRAARIDQLLARLPEPGQGRVLNEAELQQLVQQLDAEVQSVR